MKSQTIKQRNIPEYPVITKSVKVKPVVFLFVCLILGLVTMLLFPSFSLMGAMFVAASCFSLLILPDRKIIDFTEKYCILYNQKDTRECKLIYWEDVLSWQYQWHADMDELIIELIDHSVESVEVYSKLSVLPMMKAYAGEKQVKTFKKKVKI